MFDHSEWQLLFSTSRVMATAERGMRKVMENEFLTNREGGFDFIPILVVMDDLIVNKK